MPGEMADLIIDWIIEHEFEEFGEYPDPSLGVRYYPPRDQLDDAIRQDTKDLRRVIGPLLRDAKFNP